MPTPRSEHRLLSSVRAAWLTLCACLVVCPPATAQHFSAPSTISTGNRPATLLAADFTSNGMPELVALDAGATSTSATAEILANNKGTLSIAQMVSTAGPALLTMPLRAGSPPDLYWITAASGTATLYRANGQSTGTYPSGSAITSFQLTGSATPKLLLAAGALHAGYANSIIVADAVNNLLYSLLPNPDGTWAVQPATGTGEVPLIPGATQLLTADLNGDGVPDLVLANPNAVQVFVAQTNGSGSFIGFTASNLYPCTGTVGSIALDDMDGDSHLDLLAEEANGRIDIYHGNTDGTFASTSEVGTGVSNATTGNGGQLVGVADLNSDGIPDLILSNATGISVLLGTGSRNYQLNGSYAPGYSPSHFVFADLNGDGRPDIAFDGLTGVVVIYAINATPTGSLSASPEPSLYGADFTLTLALTGASGTAAPTGTVNFSIDGSPVGTGTISGSSASFTVTSPTYARGTHTLQAAYNGDSNYLATNFTGTHAVQGLPDSTSISDLVTPIYYGQEIGYTNGIDAVVSVSPTGTAAPPAGSTTEGGLIYVYLDGQLVCSLTVGAVGPSGGPQRCNDANFQGFGAGTHTMVAAYQGNSYYDPSTSPTYTVAILPDNTVTTLTSSANPSPYAAALTLTATVTAPYATPTGTVQFFDGTTLLGTVPVSSISGSFTATAAYQTSMLALGTHAITASYIPTPIPGQSPPLNFNPSQASLSQGIYIVSALAITSSLNPSVFGQSVTFTATATPANPGSVTFTVDGLPVAANVTLNASGAAAYTTSSLTVGSHVIGAQFTFSYSPLVVDPSLIQVVTAAPPPVVNGFTLSVTPATLAIGVGNTGNTTVTVAESGSFNEPVALTCSGLPYAATCTFLNPTITAGGGTTQLLIHPEAPHNCSDTSQYFIAGNTGRIGLVLATLLGLLFGWRRRHLRLLLSVVLVCLLPILGCGSNCTDLSTRPGTYTFTVTATSTVTNVAHSQNVTFQAYIDGEPH